MVLVSWARSRALWWRTMEEHLLHVLMASHTNEGAGPHGVGELAVQGSLPGQCPLFLVSLTWPGGLSGCA